MKRDRNEDDHESEQEDEGEQQHMPANEAAVGNSEQNDDANEGDEDSLQSPNKKSRTSSSSSTPRRKSAPKPILNPNSREDVLKKGSLAPDFTLLDQDSKEVTLSDFRGKEVVLFFYPKFVLSFFYKQNFFVKQYFFSK